MPIHVTNLCTKPTKMYNTDNDASNYMGAFVRGANVLQSKERHGHRSTHTLSKTSRYATGSTA